MNKIYKDIIIISSVTIFLIFIINLIITGYFTSYSKLEGEASENSKSTLKEIIFKYGLPIDSFNIIEGKIRKNQILSDILIDYGITLNQIDKLVKVANPVFDVRKIKSGNKYAVFQKGDNFEIQHFIYEESPASYIKFSFNDTITVCREQKEITRVRKLSTGVIESSLWNAMESNNLDPLLAIELSEIYAWAIDFFGIQKGDQFKVIYEEDFVDSVSIGIYKIHSACFTHFGIDYWAFEYMQDSSISYFDDMGNSLKKAFLKAPLKYSRISSKFSHSRFHPVLKIRRPHHGIDYSAPTGTPVQTIGDGVVIEKGFQKSGGGRYLKIKHNSVYTTVYMHFSKFADGINKGVRVKQGQVIGYVGSSGLATGPHLDFRVFMNGSPIDPLKLKSPPVEPISKSELQNYLKFVKKMKEEFNPQVSK